MAPDVERIIQSISLGDQDTVQLLLDSYNTQYAECFFFNTDAQERKKFRKNKIRDCPPNFDSDIDSDDERPDLLLREDLAAALLCFVSGQLQPAVLRACLHTLRILSRDRRALGPMVTDGALFTLAHLGGIDLLQPCQLHDRSKTEAQWDRTQIHRAEASGCQGAADADVKCAVSFSVPTKEVCVSTTNGSDRHFYKQRGNEGHLVLAPGKKDAREEDSEKDRKEEDGEVCRKEAMKVLCNLIYNSPKAQERASALRLLQGLWESLKQGIWSRAPPTGQFYKLRLLFLLTALRPELRLQLQQERGVLVLTTALEQYLSLRWAEGHQLITDSTAPPISKEVSQDVIEILKTIFNIAHRFYRQEPDEVKPQTPHLLLSFLTEENDLSMSAAVIIKTDRIPHVLGKEEAALYRRLVTVLRHCLLLSCDGADTLEELQGHTVNILSALPLTCLDVLLAVPVDQASHKYEGVNMDCVHALLLFMDRRLNRGQKLKEKLTPVLSLLTESSRVHRGTRHYLRQKILPPLRDVAVRPEQDSTLRGQLVRLMTHVDTDVKDCAAELLFVLCKENVSRYVKYTGYGNAAGLLAARGLLNGRRNSGDGQFASHYSSDSDSDTEEYREARSKINLVTGRVEAEQPDPMEGMTEEEKEEEARRLICMINRLSQDQIIQPMGVTADGRLAPLWGQMRGCTEEEDEEEEQDLNSMPGLKDKTIK
ncbi:synembryn-A-like isoform X2 [Girardinichthys multiradiatus]|uniref:synembryn-A-like isoform X2 n=1 Tax=Girardinichthys multiradiatus TaxID=208333 RepID=UPI001FABEA01|nr:synembryn-A-like isoform X2 [Girardinichthys multiradiatus]